MLKLHQEAMWLFRQLLSIESHAHIFIPTAGVDPHDPGRMPQVFQDSNLFVSTISEKETAYTYAEASKPQYRPCRPEILITNEVEKVKIAERFHYAFAFPPLNDDGSFQWKEDVLRQWIVARNHQKFMAPAHLMMLESMRESLLAGGYFGAVLPRNWMGAQMKYMKWWNNNAALVAKIALPKGAVTRLENQENNWTVDPAMILHGTGRSKLTEADLTTEVEMTATGNSNRWYLFIWHKPAEPNTPHTNKLFYASYRHSTFVARLSSLHDEQTDHVCNLFRKHEWHRRSVALWHTMCKETSDGKYLISQHDSAVHLSNPKDIRVIKAAESKRAAFTICNTVEEIRQMPLAVHIKLGPPTKLYCYNPQSYGALHDMRSKFGIPQSEYKRIRSVDDMKPRDEFTIRLKDRSLAENREWLLKLLLEAGLTPCITASDHRRFIKQDRWLDIQLAPLERTIRIPGQDGEDDTWEKIYDDVSVQATFPEIYKLWEKRAKSMGLHKEKWTHPYQFDDIVIQACKDSILNGNHMGLGKTREILFGALLSGSRRTLIVVPTRLIGVWQTELEETIANYVRVQRKNWMGKLMSADYQIIEWAKQCQPANLKTFNIISYEDLCRIPRDALFFTCPVCKFVVCSVSGHDKQACPRCNHGRKQKIKAMNAEAGLKKRKVWVPLDDHPDGGKVEIVDDRLSTGNTVWMHSSDKQYDKMCLKTVNVRTKDKNTGEWIIEARTQESARKPHLAWTFCSLLHNRFNMVAIEEANYIKTADANRALALNQVTARRRLALTGTPVAGYPKSVCNILNWVFKRAVFPDYRSNGKSVNSGPKKFEDKYATYVEREDGAPRLIPKINQPELFQQELAPLMLRHIRYEPEIAKVIPPKVPIIQEEVIPMDPSHRAFYMLWLEKFSEWWQKKREEEDGKENAVATNDLLVKLGYLINASSIPHFMFNNLKGEMGEWAKIIGPYTTKKMTSKFERASQLIKQNVVHGDKTIVYCWRNANIDLGKVWCGAQTPRIHAICVDGRTSNEIDPRFNRSKKQLLVDKFCQQDYHVMFANIQTMKEGFNIPQANRGIFMEYNWNAIDWQQALARMLRPAQKKTVYGTFLCHEGTADEYVSAYVQLKARSEQEGVDHQSFDDFKGSMVPDFRLYAEAIVEGNVKAMMQKMRSDLDKLKEMSGEV